MVNKNIPVLIKWNKKAILQFNNAVNYVAKGSISGAEKFGKDILEKISSLSYNPEIYSPDKYKVNNDGSFRAFEIHSYRVSYRFTESEI